jgi:uncharacterized protein YmfQ (DUF2313 family)
MNYSPISRHWNVLKKLFPLGEMEGEHDIELDVRGLSLDRADDLAKLLTNEIIPSTATDNSDIGMIGEFEQVFEIASDDARPLSARRSEVMARLVAPSGLNADFYYRIAESLGYNRYPSNTDPHIQFVKGEFLPFRVGISLVGIDAIYDQTSGSSRFTWTVQGTNVESDYVLQYIFNDLKPARSEVIFKDV